MDTNRISEQDAHAIGVDAYIYFYPLVSMDITRLQSTNIEAGNAFQRGTASWYGPGFHGRKTASGERFNSYDMTAAHRSLPFGTRLKVTNETNGRSVVVRVNDRGPFAHRRIIDLAKGPAQALGLTSAGTAYVSLHRLD